MKVEAVIAAAGKGTRFANNRPKQFCLIAGKPVLDWTIGVFDECEDITSIVLVVPGEMMNETREMLHLDQYPKLKCVVAGGAERHDSVRNGLKSVDTDTDVILVHDGVRALISSELIRSVVRSTAKHGSAIPCLPVKDTLRRTSLNGGITETVNRDGLYLAQTPQGFTAEVLRRAYEALVNADWRASDEANLLERINEPLHIVPGDERNIKITTRFDFRVAEMLLQQESLL